MLICSTNRVDLKKLAAYINTGQRSGEDYSINGSMFETTDTNGNPSKKPNDKFFLLAAFLNRSDTDFNMKTKYRQLALSLAAERGHAEHSGIIVIAKRH